MTLVIRPVIACVRSKGNAICIYTSGQWSFCLWKYQCLQYMSNYWLWTMDENVRGEDRGQSKYTPKTVLPTSLLQHVTDLVKEQTVCLSTKESNSVGAVQDLVMNTNSDTLDETDVNAAEEPAEMDCEVSGLVTEDRVELSHRPLDTSGDSRCMDVEEGSSSLLQIQLSDSDNPVRERKSKPDMVYDISLLFSGELDKRYQKELKKAKRKSWKMTKTKRKRKLSNGDKEEEEDKIDRKRRPMPNYFVSIQITNPEIHEALGKVQEDVVSANEKLKPAMNKLATLHLTMLVLHLSTEEELERCKQALDKVRLCIQKQFEHGCLVLDLCGLGNFRDEVVFARVSGEEQVSGLQHIACVVEDCFLDMGLVSPDKHGFKPHVTVMKLTRAKYLRAKGIKKIDKQTYSAHVDTSFGRQVVDSLQLCAMLKKKDESGYYHVEHSVLIGKMDDTASEKQEELIVESVDESFVVSDTSFRLQQEDQ